MVTKQNTIDELFVSLRELSRINRMEEEEEKSQPYDQVYRSTVQQQFSRFHDIDQKAKKSSSNVNKKGCSFKSLLRQLE